MNAAERIYAASTSDGEPASRLAEELARRIEDDIARQDLAPGGALGSLRELSERYCVGRSVAREALGLLERRGLGRLRPGPCGGFILARPQPDTTGEELADHFRSAGVTLRQLMDAREAIDLMAARLAAASGPDEADLAQLTTAAAADDLSGRLSARMEIARLADEPVLLLLVECLNSLTIDFGRARGARPGGGGRSPLPATAMADALRAGDVEAAVSAAALAHAELAAWLEARTEPARQEPIRPARPPGAPGTLASVVARKLADEILTSGSTGARLGSEWDLCERFEVSRLTLRQAIRLLEDSGLVECRRGRGNGLVVRDRRSAGAIRLVLAYLIGRKVDAFAVGTVLFQMNCFIPALAVSRADAEQRRQLEAALSRVEACDPFDRYDLLGLVHCMSRLADSPIIDLFSRCLAAYEARFRPTLAERLPASAQASYFRLVRRLLERPPADGPAGLTWAKAESSARMLEMSRSRPI
jgi:DNA-binding FadR family transcriptional regulator